MRKVNVFGIPVNVMSEADIDADRESGEHRFYVTMRVADMDFTFAPPGLRERVTRTLCERCRAVCWLDPVAFDRLGGVNLTILCFRCLAKQKARQ